MADKWQKLLFFSNFNSELWAIGRSCQNSVIAVRNCLGSFLETWCGRTYDVHWSLLGPN